jgi:molybdate transport system substrate-binding protein
LTACWLLPFLVVIAGTDATPARAGELTVSAAASLTAAFGEIGAAFAKTASDVAVQNNFAGSATLVQQIREGAPVDVLASADEASMQRLVDANDVAGTPEIFATNRLAILVQKGNPKRIQGLADLTRPDVRISLCGPTVPAGRYAREAFAKAGLSVPESSQELDVKAVVSRVALGEADAGVVYVTDARAGGNAVEAVAIPDAQNVTARYPVAVLKQARAPATARDYVRFVRGAEGQAILARHGFSPP